MSGQPEPVSGHLLGLVLAALSGTIVGLVLGAVLSLLAWAPG
jgi:hypothetical protein